MERRIALSAALVAPAAVALFVAVAVHSVRKQRPVPPPPPPPPPAASHSSARAMGALSTKLAHAPAGAGAGAAADAAAADALVARLVAQHPVLVFSKTYCPYCRAAKRAIADAGANVAGFAGPHVVELDARPDGAALQAALARRTARTTVPNVFVGGAPVGGGDDVDALARQGLLAQMMRVAPTRLAAAAADADAAPLKASLASESPRAGLSDSSTDDTATDAAATTASANDTASSDDTRSAAKPGVDVTTLGAGCFWGVELAMQRIPGVVRTEVGYCNGKFTPVSYDAICTGRSGHAEVVRVWYDPAQVGFADILDVWEKRHDVTSLNKQGNDRGTQYRSGIFYHGEEQKAMALAWKDAAEKRLRRKVVTEIAPVTGYSTAESYHQQYLERGGQSSKKGDTSRIRCYG